MQIVSLEVFKKIGFEISYKLYEIPNLLSEKCFFSFFPENSPAVHANGLLRSFLENWLLNFMHIVSGDNLHECQKLFYARETICMDVKALFGEK